MAKKPNIIRRWRRASQVFFLVALNPYIFLYRGVCVPAMNCWACPAAAFGCPIGAIGNFLVKGLVPFLAIGLMLIAGALIGRMICGWVCPFGLLQDLMNKIPSPKWKIPKAFAYAKYAVLVIMVFVIPLTAGIERTESGLGASDFFFCNYCPAGTLEAAIPVKLGLSRFDGATAGLETEAVAKAKGGGAADETDGGGDLFGGTGTGNPDIMGGDGEEDWLAGEDEGIRVGVPTEPDDLAAEDDGGGLFEDEDEGDLFGDASTGNPDLLGGGDDEGADWLSGEDSAPVTASASGGEILDWFLTSPRMWVLYVFLALFVFFRRPFCRAICPIGATFALLNRFSFLRMRVEKDACKACNLCAKTCPVDNKVFCTPSSDDCIRCLECIQSCKRGGVQVGVIGVKARENYWE